MNLEELSKRVCKSRERQRVAQKERYHYAKSLGFSAEEAVVLQNQGKETILRLSQERRAKCQDAG